MTIANTGICFLCQTEVEHRFVKKHIEKCLKNDISQQLSDKDTIFLIKVYCEKDFWIFVEINGSSKLEDLDAYLRETWLECCNHMSDFNINDQSYSCDSGMDKTIHETFKVGTDFEYEYDFGSTTRLEGTVISSRSGQLGDAIRLIARNHLSAYIVCRTCSKKAVAICTYCDDLMCKICKKDHGCEGEEGLLPVVNSPRMGVCGYSGLE